MDFAFRLAVFHFDRDHSGIAKKIVQASERFLISADQKDPEQVVIVFAQFVHGQYLVAFLAGEVLQHAIAVAGQIADDGFPGGRFVEPVHGHDWKQLIDGPGIGQRLEDGEISVIEVGEGVANFAQRLRRFFHGLGLGGDAGHDLPENFFTERHLADADDTEGKHLAQAVAIEDGIVITFLRAKGFDVQHDLVQAAELDIGIGWNGECFRSVEVELSDAEDVKDEHAEVASDGASGFGDEIRVRNFGFVADLGDHLDHVRAVFLQGIVAAVGAGTGSVVVDG